MKLIKEIRQKLIKKEKIFRVISFIYTPIRVLHQRYQRNKLAKQAINLVKKKYDKNLSHIWYLGVPIHDNLGDQAQRFCIDNWLRHNYQGAQVFHFTTEESLGNVFFKYLKKIINNEKDMILFQSGYCTSDTHVDQIMHIKICNCFKNVKILFMPQTVRINKKSMIKKTKKSFNNSNIIFLARDNISYKRILEICPKLKAFCYPDIVTTLIGDYKISERQRKNILLCLRNDSEKFYSNLQINKFKSDLEKFATVDVTDTNSSIDNIVIQSNFEKSLSDKLNQFADYKVVITDRFHGTIFSLISNTPVIVIKSNDYKVTSGVDWFIDEYSEFSIRKAENLNDAIEYAKDILAHTYNICNESNFNCKFYNNLVGVINDVK